jgi:hypothetical protein
MWATSPVLERRSIVPVKSHLELVANTREHGSEPRISRLDQAAFDPLDGLRLDGVRSAQEECKRDEAWRRTRVAIAAYYLAEHRGFQPGSEAADWRLAELQIDAADETYG